jgi:hypothetical protein
MSELESLSRDELIMLAREQAAVIARQDAQIAVLSTQLTDVMDRFEQTAEKLARAAGAPALPQ